MRIAIIDLGTNTFNILIVKINHIKSYTNLYQSKISVKLGEGGINKNYIEHVPFQRGIEALKTYKETMERFYVEKVFAFATSAIRSASNGNEFVEAAKHEAGIDVTMISGEKEAELIYYGVRNALKFSDKASLIIDIGGGSTEFIIADENKVYWKQSFLLGAARLLEMFQPSDKIKEEEQNKITDYLNQELQPLFEAVKKHPVAELIGSSGSFDSLAEMIAHKYYTPQILKKKTEYVFEMHDFERIYEIIINSTKEERMQMKGLVEMRVDMIVISSLIVRFVLQSFHLKNMRLSTYALKEGMLNEIMNSKL